MSTASRPGTRTTEKRIDQREAIVSTANAPGVSRASMDIDGNSYASASGVAAEHSTSRENVSTEAQRQTAGPVAIAKWAARNPAINVAKTHLNIDMTNDGEGGFRRSTSIQEVVDYGDRREERVRRGIKSGERFAVTIVHQLPWSYVEPDGTVYQPRDRDGVLRVDKAGRPIMLPRYQIKPERWDAAMAYFDDCLKFDAGLLPGGQAGIHGYSINLDESRPHLQLLSDAHYETPTKKDPEKMSSGYSRAFGSHRHDRMVQARAFVSDELLFNADGSPWMIREGNKLKFERYHREFKPYMVDLGHEVELERDELRRGRGGPLADYKDVEHERLLVAMDAAEVEAQALAVEAQRVEVAQRAEVVVTDRAMVDARYSVVEEIEGDALSVLQAAEAEAQALRTAAAREAAATSVALDLRAAAVQTEAAALTEREETLGARGEGLQHREREVALTQAAVREAQERAEAEAAEVAEAKAAAEAERQRYAEAAERVEGNLDQVGHFAVKYMEGRVLKNGETLADVVDRGAQKLYVQEYGASATPEGYAVTHGEARERKAAADDLVRAAMPTQRRDRGQAQSQGLSL